MKFKRPRETKEIAWTYHAISKMRFYGLTETRLKKVFRNPKRKEEGIAPGTIALMQPAGRGKRPHEIWLMYQETKDKGKKIITAWRYPGTSPIGQEIPIPEDIRRELEK